MYCLAAWGRNAEKLQVHSLNCLWISDYISDDVYSIPPRSLNLSMVERPAQDPDTGEEDLHTYLSSPLFSQKITCPRTSLIVSFSQIGDPGGCPVLFIPPAVCSNFFRRSPRYVVYTSPIWGSEEENVGRLMIDQICQSSGIKLISIDRPGCGFTPPVRIEERLDISCSK